MAHCTKQPTLIANHESSCTTSTLTKHLDWYLQLLKMIGQWLSEGSGWLIESVDKHYLNIVQYTPMKGSSYIKLLPELNKSLTVWSILKIMRTSVCDGVTSDSLGPIHTNPLSNENGTVLLRFQKDLPPHLSFSYRFCPSTLQHLIRFENAFIPSVGSNELDAYAFQYIGPRDWR